MFLIFFSLNTGNIIKNLADDSKNFETFLPPVFMHSSQYDTAFQNKELERFSKIKGGHVINYCGSHVSVPAPPVIALHVSFETQFPLNGHRAVLLPDMTTFTTSSGLMILCHRNNRNMTFHCDYSLCESIFGKLIL